MAREAGLRPDMTGIDDDHLPANEHGSEFVGRGQPGGLQEVGGEPNDSHERRPGAAVGRGFEGGAASPSPTRCVHNG